MSLQQALETLAATQARHVRFGACDTEPRAVVADLLDALHRGEEPEVPVTAVGWQLFSSMDGSEAAAAQLHEAATAVIAAAKADALGLGRYLSSRGF